MEPLAAVPRSYGTICTQAGGCALRAGTRRPPGCAHTYDVVGSVTVVHAGAIGTQAGGCARGTIRVEVVGCAQG